jgi:hypothetical protein
VQSGREIADWYNTYDLANGTVAWTKPARGGTYGLYVSEFKTEAKPILAITFHSERNAVWGIVGASLSDTRFALAHPVAMTMNAGANWRPFTAYLDAQPGSALDLSYTQEGPAGKYGFLTVRDGHFYFEKAPDKRVRFFGTNLCYSANYPTHKEADRIASDLASFGYNVVRFHHYDDMLTMDSKDSVTPDPEKLDRLEYLMAQCEKRGMYLVIDLYTWRHIRPGEIPEIKDDIRTGFKGLPPVLDSAMNNWKAFSRNLLTHKNPYTGKTLAEDPALIGICPVNEDPMGISWHDSPGISDLYNRIYGQWKGEHNLAPKNWDEEQQASSRFLNEIQVRAEKMYADYLHNELHVRAPLTGANCLVAIGLTEARSKFDYVDNHIYWDHPSFPAGDWQLPYRYHQISDLEAGAYVPRTLFPSRIKGKPFTVTEWNNCNPNRYRAEGAALMVAYAGLQDWDGLYRFAHSHNIDNLKSECAATGFDMATDPISQVSERFAGLMFLRGDVSPARGMVTFVVDSANGYRTIPSWGSEGIEHSVEMVGLVTGISSVWAEGVNPASINGPITGSSHYASHSGYVAPDDHLMENLEKTGVIPVGCYDAANRVYRSETGEVVLDAGQGDFSLVTPRGEWFITNKPASLKGVLTSVVTKDGPTSVAVVSLDGNPLDRSSHMLVMHVTEQVNTGEKFEGADMKMLADWGKLPHLMRSGHATLTIHSFVNLRAWALDLSGKRVREVKVVRKDGVLTIDLDNTTGKEATLVYEIAGV